MFPVKCSWTVLLFFFLSALEVVFAAPPYKPFVITVTDSKSGDPVPLVEFETVNKVSYLTDSNGQIAFFEPGLMDCGDVYFFIAAPHGYKSPEKDAMGYAGKAFQPKPGQDAEFTLDPDPDPGPAPELSALQRYRLEHAYDTRSGAFRPCAITVKDAETKRGIPLVELKTEAGVIYYTDSAGRIAFYEPDLMGKIVRFDVRSYGYESPRKGQVELRMSSGSKVEFAMERINLAERLYRITGEGIYRDSVLLGEKVPLNKPLLNACMLGQDTVDMAEYRGRLFWLWGDTDRAGYPLGNFKTTCAVTTLPDRGGLDPSLGVDLEYFENDAGFCKEMMPDPYHEGLIWMNTLATVMDGRKERLVGSFANIKGSGDVGMAVFDDGDKVFTPLVVFDEEKHHIRPTGQAHVKDGYVYINCPYATVRIKAELDTFKDPMLYEAFTCLKPGTDFQDEQTELDRDAKGRLVWDWKKNTASIGDEQWKKLLNAKLVEEDETWNRVRDVESGKYIRLAGGSSAYNPYTQCWVMIAQEQFGESFLGETWVSAAPAPEGPWRSARKVVTHAYPKSLKAYTFYNVAYHPEFHQKNGRYIYFEGTYVSTYTDTEPTPRYNYNQIMYRLDLNNPDLRKIWP
ncbi:MAG: hypothetical protein JXR25_03720 [Pontiellaceae bacterium]|nr:hypothetical protein [Pontiellaceae bacterium]MBN2783909.1 hypothetical protein [Pontiellaceae bacterium]